MEWRIHARWVRRRFAAATHGEIKRRAGGPSRGDSIKAGGTPNTAGEKREEGFRLAKYPMIARL